ncbi:hypothetical protein M758_4G158200 [Ceratodon purpureus]|nr:hypothetical protein M758_4G158200 [Ceratodon purpureus]
MMALNNMGAALIMLILVALGAEVAGHEGHKGSALEYWERKLPGMEVPAPLRDTVSPLEGSVLAGLFATQIKHGLTYPSASASFCKKAGLVCADDIHENQLDKPASNVEASIPSKGYNFWETDLFEGATMRMKEQAPAQPKPFMPRVVADALPELKPENLHKLQRIFDIGEGTDMYNALDFATAVCDKTTALDGEDRVCPASLESFADFVSAHVGPDLKVLTSSPRPRVMISPMKVSNFAVHRSVEDNLNVVVCHILNFPSKMYMCHSVPDTNVIEASMTDVDGVEIRAVGVCHLGTKMPDLSLTVFGLQPGSPVCHWNAQESMVFYGKASAVVKEKTAGHAQGEMAMAMKLGGHDHMGM